MTAAADASNRAPVFQVVAALDRFNYGDVLFAHVARHIIAGHCAEAEIEYYGLRRVDLTAAGGVRSFAARDLYSRGDLTTRKRVVFVAGGGMLVARWASMAEDHLQPWSARWLAAARQRIGAGRMDELCRRWFGVPNRMPGIFDPDDFPDPDGVAVVYNSVGGPTLRHLPARPWMATALQKATWLSVRDSRTVASVEELGVARPRLSPDSAVLMGELYTRDDLASRRARILGRLGLPASAGYFCIQSALRYLDGHEKECAASLRRLHERFAVPVIALAIGRATGHEDQTAARRLARVLDGETWFHVAPEDLTVQDIMALIAGSDCNIGTSLHGMITAFVFGRPRVGLDIPAPKVSLFRADWDLPTIPVDVPYGAIDDGVRQALENSPEALKAQASRVVDCYRAVATHMWTAVDAFLAGRRDARSPERDRPHRTGRALSRTSP